MDVIARLVLAQAATVLGREREVPAVEKLQQQHEDVVAHNAHGNDARRAGLGLIAAQLLRIAAEDHAKEGAPCRQHAAVGVHVAILHIKRDIAKRLAFVQEVQKVGGERLQGRVICWRSHRAVLLGGLHSWTTNNAPVTLQIMFPSENPMP